MFNAHTKKIMTFLHLRKSTPEKSQEIQDNCQPNNRPIGAKEKPMNPVIVAIRTGKKGPGKTVIVATNQTEAEAIGEMLNVKDGQTIVYREVEPLETVTADEFKERYQAKQKAEQDKADALAKLTADERAALGL